MNPIPPRSKLILKGQSVVPRPQSFHFLIRLPACLRGGGGVAWTISFTSVGRSGGRVIECRRTKEGYGNHEFNKGTAENLYNSLFLSLPLQRRSHRVEVDGRRRLLLNSCGGNVSSPLSLSLFLPTTFISHFYYIPENGKCAKKRTQE